MSQPHESWDDQQQYRQQQYGYPQQVAPRSPALGLLVSFFLPGVGSMIAGRVGKGTGILVGYVVGWFLCVILIGFIIMPAFWIWGLVAGYTDTVAWNRERGIIS